MDRIEPWVAGIAMVALSLFGLGIASAAVDAPFHLFGLTLFAFGVSCVFALIVRHTGHHPEHRRAQSAGNVEVSSAERDVR